MFKRTVSMMTAALLLAAGITIIGSTSAAAANIASGSTVSLISMDPTMSINGQCTLRQSIGSSTRVTSWTSGDNLDFSLVSTSSFVWGSTHDAAYTTVLARSSTTRTTFTPVTGTTYTFYRLKEGTTSANYFCHAGQVDLLVNSADAITGWVVSPHTFFTAGESSGVISGPTAEQIEALQAAIAAAIIKAKTTLYGSLQGDKPGTLEQYRAAEFNVNNDKVVAKVNAAVLKLPLADRENSEKISAIIKVENFVDLISTPATQKFVTSKNLVDLGLIASSNLNKTTVALALKKKEAASLNSVQKIQEAIKTELESIQARKDRLAAIKAKIAARNK